VKAAADNDNWRQKYFDSLTKLESEQTRFKALESTLKRLAGRLCTAALGQSSRLDAEIKKLQSTLRRDTTQDELEKLTPALTEAIQSLDQPATAPATNAPPPAATTALKISADATRVAPIDEERIRGILSALLVELKRDNELASQAETLDAKLGSTLSVEQLPELLSSLTELVGQRISRIEHAKGEIETLLSHMVGKLDEIGKFVAEQSRSQSESHASSETLNVQLVGEMKAMGESVEAANDLQQIRSQVRGRLDSIDRHLQEFRLREATLTATMQARSEQMHSRIAELEAEAGRLQTQLLDEQRLSSIDMLTKVPNRLAYEKRMEDELKRWQRFKQPTCLAVWDVDHFKRINDTYGHRAGDRVLRAVADSLSSRIRATDFLARYGGEEFVMILSGTKMEDAVRLLNEMRISVSNIGFHFRGTPVSITISSGVTSLQPGDSAGVAFDRADKALYHAKDSGRNRCVNV
jgi:diguanylate cyclase